jgi:hypothetical protein
MKEPVKPLEPGRPMMPAKETVVFLPIDIYSLKINKLSDLEAEVLKQIVSCKGDYGAKQVVIDESKINVLDLPVSIYEDSYSYRYSMQISVPCEYKDVEYQSLIRYYNKQMEKHKKDMVKYSIKLKEYEEKYKVWEQQALIEEDVKLKKEKKTLEKRLKLIEKKIK